MRNSWVPRVVTLVVLSVFFTPDVAFAGRIRRWRGRDGTSLRLLSSNSSGASFGSCSTPQIKFAQGLDGRKETAFEAVDLASFPHGSADNIGVITSFMCNELTNTCKANQAAKDLCTQAESAASSATPPQTGAQADAFNKVFGLNTNFKAVTPIDNTGKAVGGASNPSSTPPKNGTSLLANSSNPNTTPPNNGTALTNSSASGTNFGSCSTPQIKFAPGLDNRKETAFEPVDLASYSHGSAQNINIITQFMCDALTNTCKANQAAKDLCAQAKTAADSATPPKTGTQADVFNKFFGSSTNFSAVTPLDDKGEPPCANIGPSSGPSTNGSILISSSASGPNFGSCSTPQIKFAPGLDGRKETAFEAVDLASFPHGSADNIGVITSFMCDELTNTCKADQAAKDLCTQAESAASNATPPQTGAQADAFNKVFGLNTNFTDVTPIDNTGNPVKTQ